VTGGVLDTGRLGRTTRTAVRMLDNVIDINLYPIPEARAANMRHRPVGLGLMGFQDALHRMGVSYASDQAMEVADRSMEVISWHAIMASSDLAAERGRYESYSGSKWDRGLLPIDTIDLLEQERGVPIPVDRSRTLDWDAVRERVRTQGMRNSNLLAIAPTATIANICDVSQSIEPTYKNLFAKSNLSGEFTVVNRYLVEELRRLGLWDDEMVEDLKYFDGAVQEIARIPEEIRNRYLTAFEMESEWLVEAAARRQKWIDMGQSLNLYLAAPRGKRLSEMYQLAWEKGLKTTYYLRTLGAGGVEKSTMDISRRGIQPRWMKSKSASSGVQISRKPPPMPVAVCNLDGDCESCQ
jgi:ribonucleoside-diphosphate reductase alpha chain